MPHGGRCTVILKLTRYLLGICLLVCSMQGSAVDNDGNAEVYGILCANYIKAYAIHINANLTKDKRHPQFAESSGYIAGYLSAVNLYKANGLAEIRGGHSFETVYLYVDKHCRDNPLHTVVNALNSFVIEMERK